MIHSIQDFWRFRSAIRAFATLNLRLRYSNTALGFLWSLANPLFLMSIFTFVFTVLTPNGIVNFPVFALSGILPWNFFSTTLSASIVSITNGRELISKVPFPREILPISYVLSELTNFILALSAVTLVFGLFGLWPGWKLLALPLLIAILLLFTMGVGLLLATVNVRLRDTQEFISVFLFGWFFLTPVVYPIENIPLGRLFLGIELRTLVQFINPMSAIVTGFRRVLYNHEWPDWGTLAVVTLISAVIFVVSYSVFRRASPGFAEAI
jgi:lipopolysaccharide transport system permease protein